MRKILTISLLIATIVGCNRPEKEVPSSDPVILSVGSTDVELATYQFFLEKAYPELIGKAVDDETASYLFDVFKRDMTIAEFARVSGLRVTDDQIESFINENMTGMTFGLLSEEQQKLWRDEIRRRLAIQQFLTREVFTRVTVEDEEVSEYYQEQEKRLKRPKQYQIRLMQAKDKESADAFYEALGKSKDPFHELAKDYAVNEGYKFITSLPYEDMPKAFQEQVKRLRPGQSSRVVEIQFGETTSYYVFHLESVSEAVEVDFETVYARLRAELEAEQIELLVKERLEEFEKKIKIKIHKEQLPFRYIPEHLRSET